MRTKMRHMQARSTKDNGGDNDGEDSPPAGETPAPPKRPGRRPKGDRPAPRRRTTPERETAKERMIQAIRDAREARGITATELGKMISPPIGQRSMSRIEAGEYTTFGTGQNSRTVGLYIGLIAEFEQALGLEAGQLMVAAGYIPPPESSVILAIEADDTLDRHDKNLLFEMYYSLTDPPNRRRRR